MRAILILIGLAHCVTGAAAFLAPQFFYDAVPGLSMMGPYNTHFIRDVGLAFLVSGGAIVYGVLRADRGVAIVGAAWPFLHALFHVQIHAARGLPMDGVMVFDLAAVISPALLAIALALRMPRAV